MRTLLPFLKPYRKECVLAPLFKLLEAVPRVSSSV